MADISLPYNWKARPHQVNFMRAMAIENKKRAVCVWHRRAGKDSASINFTAVEAHRKVATYWHMLPTQRQGRKVIWDAINPFTGQKVIDQAFPPEIRQATNNTDMKIELKSGSIWQVVGSDSFDSLVGSNPFGVVFSEYSIADPRAWDFIRPILMENGGWAIFIYTPRGKNHGWDLYQMAKDNPDWFCELLTIEDTKREDGTPIVSRAQFEEEIKAGMDPLLAQQEFYCSFDAGLFGAYYTEELKRARFGDFPWDPRKPVHTFWDLGLRDATAIWFLQEGNDGWINVIDYMEMANVSLIDWCKMVNEQPYSYGLHVAPHDIKRRDYATATSYLQTAAEHGISFEIAPQLSIREGIDAVKAFLPRCRFNMKNTSRGVDALYNYRREYNEKLKVFLDRPVHDWASHGADAFRIAALTFPENYRSLSAARHRVIPAIRNSSGVTRRQLIRHGRIR